MVDSAIADIEAMIDVLRDIGEGSDSLDVEGAVQVRHALADLGQKVRETIGLVDTQMVQVLESPRIFGGTEYSVAPDGVWRPDHGKIKEYVKKRALVDTDTGEIVADASTAVDRTIVLMYDLFVTAKGFPKQGGLDKMLIDKPDVGHYERKGKRVATRPAVPTKN